MHAYAKSNHGALIEKINATADFNDEIAAGLKKAVEDFKANGAW